MDGCGSDDGRSRRVDDQSALSSHDHIVLHLSWWVGLCGMVLYAESSVGMFLHEALLCCEGFEAEAGAGFADGGGGERVGENEVV